MLKLCNIIKEYETSGSAVEALKGVSIEFRKSEFVSILGPSGCGKTTLLNIIGGLDRYTSGDLIIKNKSTKEFTDRDWDSYRNHSVGFVFQNYNLIPHQTVLANVELALTLSGVSKAERRKRAEEALSKVGLDDQKHKRPNQMSGGQMQRVAIARALVNDPQILLADEPTGALDSETSVQIMDILKEISKERLVIMVTHNPELAEQYSTRIVRLLDGRIIGDTSEFHGEQVPEFDETAENNAKKNDKNKTEKTSMSFFTALSLSLRNLMSKKARTTMVSFAGSIGIIGIALILALSNGIQIYIDSVQEDTLSSYPLTIEAETMDMSGVLTTLAGQSSGNVDHELDKIYSNPVMYKLLNSMSDSSIKKNNLEKFKKYLDANTSEISKYTSSIQYGYNVNFNVYTKEEDGTIWKADVMELLSDLYGENTMQMGAMYSGMDNFTVWEEMLHGEDGEFVSDTLKNQYILIDGRWPEKYNEVMVVVDKNNEVNDIALYALGLKTKEEINENYEIISKGEKLNEEYESWAYEEVLAKSYRLVSDADYYRLSADGKTYSNIGDTDVGNKFLYDNGIEIKVCGIIRPNEDASASMLTGSIAYTSALTDVMVKKINESDAVKIQKENAENDIFTGLPFKPADYEEPDNSQKAKDIKEYIASLSADKKAELALDVLAMPDEVYINAQVEATMKNITRESIETTMLENYSQQANMDKEAVKKYMDSMDDESLFAYVKEMLTQQVTEQYVKSTTESLSKMSPQMLSATLDSAMAQYDEAKLGLVYDSFMPAKYSGSTLEDNLKKLGIVSADSPKYINLFASTFEDKDKITQMIDDYNASQKVEENKINYTDYVGIIMSSVTTIITAISYVLIAFVAISLIVSSIMIGIITYISVLERTKEIGVLRSIGASKKDIKHVFNAETIIIGFTSGTLGIIVTLILTIPINIVIRYLTGINVYAALPVVGGIALIVISIVLNWIAGLLPASMAAKKDPVVALRTE